MALSVAFNKLYCMLCCVVHGVVWCGVNYVSCCEVRSCSVMCWACHVVMCCDVL